MTDFQDYHDFQFSDLRLDDGMVHESHAESDAFHYSPTVVEYDLNGDGRVDMVSADTDHDGKADAWQYDLDNDGIIDMTGYDVDGDGSIDLKEYDRNADGLVDEAVVDMDHDNRPQVVVQDTDHDGQYDLETWDLHEREDEGPSDPHSPNDGDTAPAVPRWGTNAHYGGA
ncbi:hypothetical protein ACFFX1_18940 [Dactylosporangium sucinum]|uniref:EF-hand domain-containing protein n=1 Tax=Dactylosporangium sucinum TaxID=1424081 RepID=A0A917X006_9ACTN|nr:hypothetical protein [Dactylosporangium sucinum]GGM46934.1 hypothetical protein GCM10007977_055760 [Dactylosporangium sucinum]